MSPRRVRGVDFLGLGGVLCLLSAIGYLIGAEAPRDDDGATAPALTVLAVDVSASVTRPRPGFRRWSRRCIEEEARRASLRGDDLALITFDRSVVRRFGPGTADSFFEAFRREAAVWLAPTDTPQASLAADLGTDLHGAATVAAGLMGFAGAPGLTSAQASPQTGSQATVATAPDSAPVRPAGTLIVIGDGTSTTHDPQPAFLDDRIGTLRLVAPGPPVRHDLAVISARAPDVVEPGVPVAIDLDLAWSKGEAPVAGVVVDWVVEATSVDTIKRGLNRPSVLTGSVRFPLPALTAGRDSSFTLSVAGPALETGTATMDVSARLVGGDKGEGSVVADAFPENDRDSVTWTVGDPLQVLLVMPHAEQLSGALGLFVGESFGGIEFTGATSSALEDLLLLPDDPPFDVIVTLDLPVAALPEDALSDWVLERGGGWVHAAGWPRLRADGGSLTSLLALEPDRDPMDPRDIVFVVDGSGSMKGARWSRARSAIGELMPSIPARDRLSLRFFTQLLGDERFYFEGLSGGAGSSVRAEGLRDALRTLRDTTVPGGSTNISGSLSALIGEREEAAARGEDVREALVVLISDGLPTSSGGPRQTKSVKARFASRGDEVVAIHVGDDRSGVRYLSNFVDGEEAVRSAGELVDVLAILQEAVQGTTLLEDVRARRTSLGLADPGLLAAARETQDLFLRAGPARIARSLPCRAATGASVLFDSEPIEARPSSALVALAARGKGTVAGLGFVIQGAAGVTWSPEFQRRIGCLGPMFRAMRQRRDAARNDSAPRERPRARMMGGEIVLTGLGADAPAVLRAVITRPPTVDAFGSRVSGKVLGQVELVPSAFDADPSMGGSRRAQAPPCVDEFNRGDVLMLRPEDVAGAAFPALRLTAEGPVEALAHLPTRSLRRDPHGAFFAAQARSAGNSGSGRDEPRRSHPAAPWLLCLGLVSVFAGALLRE